MSESKAAGYGYGKKDFANAVKYNPDDYELYVGIYENLTGNNMTEEGEEYLNKAFDIKGNSAENLTWRGRIYYLLGQYDNAVKELEGAVKRTVPKQTFILHRSMKRKKILQMRKNIIRHMSTVVRLTLWQ